MTGDDKRTEGAIEGRAEEQVGAVGLWPPERMKPLVEALLFACGDPLPVARICALIEGARPEEVVAALRAIATDCRTRGIRLSEVAGGWQLRTAPEHHALVKQLFRARPYRVTRAATETLAIVAYRQPVTRAEIEAIRGVDCAAVLESLLERRLLRTAGRRETAGRPLLYATTNEFLELFCLKNLQSLPKLPELGDEMTAMAERAGFLGRAEQTAMSSSGEQEGAVCEPTTKVQATEDQERKGEPEEGSQQRD